MEGDINWTTVAISWLFSTITTFIIIYLAFQVKRCCGKNRKKQYDATKGLAYQADMADWYSDKPLKTSSPRTQRSNKQDEILRQELASKVLNNGNTLHKTSQKDGIKYRPIPPKEESILRKPEKKTLLTSNVKPPQTIHKALATESCIKSISIHCMNPSRDCHPLTLIQTLTSSPTEKRRQSNERLKTRRASAYAASEGNVTEPATDGRKHKAQSTFHPDFRSAGQISTDQVTARRPPRPNKLISSATGSITKGLSTGHFEFRSGSNSPPPILLPLTASTASKRGIHQSQHSISKSFSSDTFQLKSLSRNTNYVAILSQSDKVQSDKIPQTVLCNSSC